VTTQGDVLLQFILVSPNQQGLKDTAAHNSVATVQERRAWGVNQDLQAEVNAVCKDSKFQLSSKYLAA
jgi:hypothetical protein